MHPTEGRRVVVTGANEGIGYHLLTSLIEDGYRVAGLDIDGGHIEPLQESYPKRVRFLECDVTVDDDVEAAVEEVRNRWAKSTSSSTTPRYSTSPPSETRRSPTRNASSR